MKLATVRIDGKHRAARIDGETATLLAYPDVRAVLDADAVATVAGVGGDSLAVDQLDFAPVVPSPDKIVCVGLNYADHIAETGRDRPTHPTYFSKFRRALVGANDKIVLPSPAISEKVDWEGELAIVIGSEVRNANPDEAAGAIAGFTVLNDVSMRDWQFRTTQFLAGKSFEACTPVGPCLITVDEVGPSPALDIVTTVDGIVKQSSNTRELVFTPVDIIADLSQITTLDPGDIIATGTPSGVGAARTPPEFLSPGSTLVTSIAGIGELRNSIVGQS